MLTRDNDGEVIGAGYPEDPQVRQRSVTRENGVITSMTHYPVNGDAIDSTRVIENGAYTNKWLY
ncbi:MAG: hypothetical protein K2W82_00780 [Candidatus Obscuribacterales bacterium]|nr:hypothetical protein [Candidatus Obscuribacterales bacterium]